MSCCSHLFEISNVTPKTPNGCEECLKIGDRWVHLRLCMTCGHVGCCDDSRNKHAAKHFHSTNHPIVKSFEPREDWGWCYVEGLPQKSGCHPWDTVSTVRGSGWVGDQHVILLMILNPKILPPATARWY
jgi:hypothetical protein